MNSSSVSVSVQISARVGVAACKVFGKRRAGAQQRRLDARAVRVVDLQHAPVQPVNALDRSADAVFARDREHGAVR